MSGAAQRQRTLPIRAAFIAYGAPAIAALAYLTFWPICLNPILHLYQPISLRGPLWTYPFHDLDAVLWSIACARQGVDVTVPNACMNGGLFQYSPLLLQAAALPIGRALRVPWGLGLDAAFLLSLYALPPPRRWREFWCLLLAGLSCSTYWALETANIDIALYLLVLLAVHLLLRGDGMRLAGYATLLVAAAIKFYPACLLVLAARERPARFVPIALASLAAAGLLAIGFAGELGHILPHLPQDSEFGGIFAASNLPRGLALLMAGHDSGDVPDRVIRVAAMLGLIVLGALIARPLVPSLLPALRAMAPRQRMLLVAGAVSITFCFLMAQNFMYRQIFLVLTLPGFWDLERTAPDPASRARVGLACWVVVGLMWSHFFQFVSVPIPEGGPGGRPVFVAMMTVWLVREVLWWWLTGLLAAVILCFLWDAPVLARWRVRAPSASW